MEDRLKDVTERMRVMEARSAFVKAAWALAKGGSAFDASTLAEKHFGSERNSRVPMILRGAVASASTTDSGWASELGNYRELTREWVSLLNSRTLLGQLNFRRAAFHTRTLVENTPGSAGWTAAGEPAAASAFDFADATLDVSKVAAIVFFTRESVESWNQRTAQIISEALIGCVARFIDQALLEPNFSAVTGKNPASLTNGIGPRTSTGSSAAQTTADILALLQSHTDAGNDLRDVVLVMHPADAVFLATLKNTNGDAAYPNLGARGGAIFGIPVLTSTGAAMIGSPPGKIVAAIDPRQVLLADDGGISIEPSDFAAVQMVDDPSGGPTNAVSLMQTHSTALRIVRYLTWTKATTSAASYMVTNY